MITTEGDGLRLIKTWNSGQINCIQLWQNDEGRMLISCNSISPGGIVYFATTASLLCSFAENKMSLQELFAGTPSFIVKIIRDLKSDLYSTRDVDIELASGDQTLEQLTRQSLSEM